MYQKILVALLLMFLFTPIFSMSGDGGQQPVRQLVGDKTDNALDTSFSEKGLQDGYKEEQPELPEQADQANSNKIAKDRNGINTGMTKEELNKFKEDYMKLEKQIYPYYNISDWFFNQKIDLNKRNELKKAGVDLNQAGSFAEAKTYKENALFCDVIITGYVEKIEELPGITGAKLIIDKVIKGENVLIDKYGKVPGDMYFRVYHQNVIDLDNQPLLNKKGLYFINIKHKNAFPLKIGYSTLIEIEPGKIMYEKNYDTYLDAKKMENSLLRNSQKEKPAQNPMVDKYKRDMKEAYEYIRFDETWEEVMANIKKVMEINDADNFYKKQFKITE